MLVAVLLLVPWVPAHKPAVTPAPEQTTVPQPYFSPDGTVEALMFSPDSRWLAVHGKYENGTYFTQLWAVGKNDPMAGERVQVMGGGAPWAFSADSKLLATTYIPRGVTLIREGEGTRRATVMIYDVTGRMNTKPRQILEPSQNPEYLFFVDQALVAVDQDGVARTWDVASGSLEDKEEWGTATVAYCASRSLLAMGWPEKLVLRDAQTPRVLKEIALEGVQKIETIRFSPDGRMLVLGVEIRQGTSTLTLYDTVSLNAVGRMENTSFVSFLPDGRMITHASGNPELRESNTSKLLPGLPKDVHDVYASPDGRLLLDSSGGVVTFRDPATWQRIAYWLPVAAANTEHPVVAIPDGLFDGDPGNWKNLGWRFGDDPRDVTSAEALAEDWYQPGLLGEVISGRPPKSDHALRELDRRQPELEITLAGKQPMFSSRSIELAIRVKRAPAGAKDLRLFRNGLLIKHWHGTIGESTVPVTFKTAVASGVNTFIAYAFNRDNVKSADAKFRYEPLFPEPRETATIIAFGINEYRQPSMRLRYAVPDATSFASDLKDALERTGNWDEVRAVPLLDRQVTRDAMLGAIRRLAGEDMQITEGPLAEIRRSGPSDTVFLFFAGHGTTIANRFYLLPHEVGWSKEDIVKSAVSDADLELVLESVDAREIVVILDSCHSGQMLESEEARLGPLNSRGLAHLAYEKGMYVLVAAQAHQQALEVSRLGHGLLTYALVKEGLGEAAREADIDPADGVVDLNEWLVHAAERVPGIQADIASQAGRGMTIEDDATPNQVKTWEPQRPRLYVRRDLERKAPPIINLNKRR